MNGLLAEARNGSTEARGRLMDELKRYLNFIAKRQFDRTLQAKMGPSDIVQESMMRAVNHLDQFRGQTLEEFRGWVRQILINEARQMNRDWRAQKRNVDRERRLVDSQSKDIQAGLSDSLPTPGTYAAAEEQSVVIRAALEKLDEEQNQIIRWRNWEGLSFEEIAHRLDTSISTASRKWYQALVAFKEKLSLERAEDE